MPTFADLKAFVRRDGWEKVPNLARNRRRTGDHWRYAKELPDGSILRTKVSHSLRDEIGPDLFKRILREQLHVSEAEFWAVIRGDVLTGPSESGPEPIPAWLVQRLIHTVGLPESEVRAMAAEQAHRRWIEFQASGH